MQHNHHKFLGEVVPAQRPRNVLCSIRIGKKVRAINSIHSQQLGFWCVLCCFALVGQVSFQTNAVLQRLANSICLLLGVFRSSKPVVQHSLDTFRCIVNSGEMSGMNFATKVYKFRGRSNMSELTLPLKAHSIMIGCKGQPFRMSGGNSILI